MSKLKKLLNHPFIYIEDMLGNIIEKNLFGMQNLFKKKKGFSKYSIVTACYNAEQYLDALFKSLEEQILDFRNNITCIMVDDGSTDHTKLIINKWIAKYPKNIHYIYKENGGVASARNIGLMYVNTPYVTFIDSDDFVNKRYFYNVDNFLEKNNNNEYAFISCNTIKYIENSHKKVNNHPLRFKFNKSINIVESPLNDGKNIQLFVNATFFRTEIIKKFNISFITDIKPSFEDGHLIFRYLHACNGLPVAFLKKSEYFYRKREKEDSLIDKSWTKKNKFYDILKFGYLDLLKNYKGCMYLYSLILYEITWHIKYIVNSPEKIELLTNEERTRYIKLIKDIFEYIPDWYIMYFSLGGCWYYHKMGMLNCFKNQQCPEQNIIYLENYDYVKNEVKIRYFYSKEQNEEFYNGTQRIFPNYKKRVKDDFCNNTFIYQKILWIPLSNIDSSIFVCKLDGLLARISINGEIYNFVQTKTIKDMFYNIAQIKMKDHWILMDRNSQADDNAEHLYRWIKKNHPEQKIYFVLNRNSHDWNRLHNEGFALLEYGSRKHKKMLLTCSKIISSQIDRYVVDYFKNGSTDHIPIVFLQHGVIKDDLSRWLNSKKRIDLFLTSSQMEYESIIKNESRYLYTDKEVKLLGLPRHDALLRTTPKKKEIVIMPTWRNYLSGKVVDGNIRENNPNFMESNYAKAWTRLLKSKLLKELSESYQYSIIFYPHANVQQYLEFFDIPDYIMINHHYDGSIQQVFKEASVMITDYSSVAFEFAYLKKPVIYYQFDKTEFFHGEHVYQKGYYSYDKDGFGPVVENEDILIAELEKIVKNGCVPEDKYRKRMESCFAYRDGKCCERVFNAICSLDKN